MQVSKGSTRRWAAIPFLVGITLLLLGPGPAATAVGASGTPLGLPNVASEVGVLVSPAFLSTGSIREVGPMPENAPISVTVGLSPSNGAGLAEAIALEYTPGSAQYHHYLTATEIADRFGPSPASYDRAVQYFRSFGLSVTTSPDRSMLFVSGTAGGVGTAFGTSFAYYLGGDRTFYSHPTPARLPAGIPWQGVVGLGNESAIRPSATPLLRAPAPASAPSASCPSSSWVTPCLAHSAYNLTSLLSAGFNGTGYRVGIVDTYDAAETQSQLASDYSSFVQGFALPHGNVSYVYPVPNSGNLNRTYTGWGAEEALDLEWTRAMAPGASIDMTLAPNSNTGLYESVDWLVAHDAVNVITMSWGENDVGVFNSFAGGCQSACNASSDGSYETLHPVLEAAAAEGISVFAASGDCGAADGTNGVSTNYPASDPYVTGVGGTDLTLTSSGGFGGESGWSGNSSGSGSPGCQNQGGSGGGYSPFPRPSWQSATGVPAKPALRGVPDVAMIGGSPGAEIVIGGSLSAEGGTSLSSPMWAGVAAVADSDAGTALGFLNPSLYGVARGSSGHSAFHNVSGGYNGYSAGKGWNPVTGLGSPNAMVLIPLLSASTVPASTTAVALTANPRYGAAPLTVRVHANATGGLAPASFFDVSFGDGNSTTTVNGNATYTYTKDGVYPVIATEFDTSGNSSTSQPVAVVVGGGGPLTVSLNVTPARPAIDASVTFQTNVTGGVGPFTYSYLFGDGTNLLASNQSVVTHGYGFSGGFCPVVVVSDAQQPPDGGESSAVGVLVGGAATARCAISPAFRASLTVPINALDLPGDFVFDPVASGGVPPYSVTYTANDPYASACRCTSFSSTGNHTVSATVSDSLDAVAVATANVTLYPALSGQFTAAPRSGPAPLQVNFGAALSGGHLANAATTRWEFGDGTNATGALASHVYPNPGYYVATALASDGFGGHASAAFLIDAYANGSAPSTVLTAEVTPALDVPVGVPVNYTATATGSVGPYLLRWGLGDNATAFGPSVSETYPYDCTSGSSCPRSVHLAAEDALGRWTNLTIPLDPVESGNATALTLSLSGVTPRGVTPYTLHAAALAEGMPATSLSWSFGDGGSASGPYGNHTYLSPGNYTVSVRASDPFGDQLIENRAVIVSGIQRYPPTVQASSNVSAGLGPLYVDFSAAASGGSGGPYSYAWSFGDGTNGSGPSAAHLYEHAGSFVANVSATDRIGESATVGIPVRVYAPTPISITISGLPTTLDVGSVVPVSLRERPSCGPDSEPNCTASTVPLRYLVRSASAPAPVNGTPPAAVLTPNSRGYANFTLPAPASAGAYVLYAWASTNAYYGNGSAAFTANGPTPIQPAKQDLGMEELEGAALVLVAALVVTVALVLRRRRRPKPRRSARSDRPTTP